MGIEKSVDTILYTCFLAPLKLTSAELGSYTLFEAPTMRLEIVMEITYWCAYEELESVFACRIIRGGDVLD